MIRFFIMINNLLAARVLLDERALTRSRRPSSAHRSGPKLAARRGVALTATLNRFSARTNVGLAAVALVLALLLTVTAWSGIRRPFYRTEMPRPASRSTCWTSELVVRSMPAYPRRNGEPASAVVGRPEPRQLLQFLGERIGPPSGY